MKYKDLNEKKEIKIKPILIEKETGKNICCIKRKNKLKKKIKNLTFFICPNCETINEIN